MSCSPLSQWPATAAEVLTGTRSEGGDRSISSISATPLPKDIAARAGERIIPAGLAHFSVRRRWRYVHRVFDRAPQLASRPAPAPAQTALRG